jgi:DNA polymerase elongation subunit (family B)
MAEGDAKGAMTASEKAAEFKQKAKKDQDDAEFAKVKLTSEENRDRLKNENAIRVAQIQKTVPLTYQEKIFKAIEGKTPEQTKAILDSVQSVTSATTIKDETAVLAAKTNLIKAVEGNIYFNNSYKFNSRFSSISFIRFSSFNINSCRRNFNFNAATYSCVCFLLLQTKSFFGILDLCDYWMHCCDCLYFNSRKNR